MLLVYIFLLIFFFFFFNDTATTEIYTTTDTLSLHDALPIPCASPFRRRGYEDWYTPRCVRMRSEEHTSELQSPVVISYAVFCLKKKQLTFLSRAARLRVTGCPGGSDSLAL